MQKTVRKATAPALREGIQMHIEQTQVQIERIEQIMEKMQDPPWPQSLRSDAGTCRGSPARDLGA